MSKPERLAGTASPCLGGAPRWGAGGWAQVAKRGGDAASTAPRWGAGQVRVTQTMAD
ncbi:MAG: hypothetical protein ACOX9C_08925 [Kiritimatiellia bacterium]